VLHPRGRTALDFSTLAGGGGIVYLNNPVAAYLRRKPPRGTAAKPGITAGVSNGCPLCRALAPAEPAQRLPPCPLSDSPPHRTRIPGLRSPVAGIWLGLAGPGAAVWEWPAPPTIPGAAQPEATRGVKCVRIRALQPTARVIGTPFSGAQTGLEIGFCCEKIAEIPAFSERLS
jgi:hypothetical protein